MPIKRTWVSWMSVAAIGVPMRMAASPVPEILATDFGYSLTGPDGLELWWCEGTYKVGRERETPTSTTTHVEIAAARNEYEPFQLVLRPADPKIRAAPQRSSPARRHWPPSTNSSAA